MAVTGAGSGATPLHSGTGNGEFATTNAKGSSPSPLRNRTRAIFTDVEKCGEGTARKS